MYHVILYEQIRRACKVEGKSQRSVAEKFGVSRWMVRKMLKHHAPPGYCRQQKVKHHLMDSFEGIIADIIEADKTAPKKQRHTSRRIYDLLFMEHGFQGNYSTVTRYMKKHRFDYKEAYIPLVHKDGSACYDFGEAYVYFNDIKVKIHFAVMNSCRTDEVFVKAYEHENTQAFQDSHGESFNFFGGVPTDILYDNTGIAVTMRGKNKERAETLSFTQLKSYYLFKAHFCAPGKGNEKGKVENKVGYVRRNFLTPVPRFKDLAELNAHLLECCKTYKNKRIEEIGEDRFKEVSAKFLPLPKEKFCAAHLTSRTVTKMSLVRFGGNDYSVPTQYVFKDVMLKAYYDHLDICYQSQLIATHKRCYVKGEQILCPYHYLDLIKRKIRSIGQAAPLKGMNLPECFDKYHKRLKEAYGKKGDRDFIDILKLLEIYPLEKVTQSIRKSLASGSTDSHTIKQYILNQESAVRPDPVCVESYDHLPALHMPLPNLKLYDDLRRT